MEWKKKRMNEGNERIEKRVRRKMEEVKQERKKKNSERKITK